VRCTCRTQGSRRLKQGSACCHDIVDQDDATALYSIQAFRIQPKAAFDIGLTLCFVLSYLMRTVLNSSQGVGVGFVRGQVPSEFV
jgi:hypothetical protein